MRGAVSMAPMALAYNQDNTGCLLLTNPFLKAKKTCVVHPHSLSFYPYSLPKEIQFAVTSTILQNTGDSSNSSNFAITNSNQISVWAIRKSDAPNLTSSRSMCHPYDDTIVVAGVFLGNLWSSPQPFS